MLKIPPELAKIPRQIGRGGLSQDRPIFVVFAEVFIQKSLSQKE
jgi:hypothetical protein